MSLSVNGTMPAWSERARGEPVAGLHRLLPARRRAGVLHEQPGHGAGDPDRDVRRRAVARLRRARSASPSRPATALLIGMDRGAIRAGLFGFNGVLVGAGLSLFLQPDWDLLVMVWIVVGAAFSTILHAALASVFLGVVQGAAVHARVQLHDADLPDRRAELRQRPRRRADRAGRRAGHRRERLQHAALRRRRRHGQQPRGHLQRDLPRHRPAVLRQQRVGRDHHHRRHRRVLADRGGLRARRLDRGHAHRARARRQRRGHLQRPVGLQLVRRRARRRRRVLRAHLAGRDPRRRLRGLRGDALRRDRLALHPLGPSRPDPALLLRDARVRAAEGRRRTSSRRSRSPTSRRPRSTSNARGPPRPPPRVAVPA